MRHPVLVTREYLAKIRNDGKREYAQAYVAFVRGAGLEPDRKTFGISFMAAQAVRIEMDQVWKGESR
jgi:hypothetical protein